MLAALAEDSLHGTRHARLTTLHFSILSRVGLCIAEARLVSVLQQLDPLSPKYACKVFICSLDNDRRALLAAHV